MIVQEQVSKEQLSHWMNEKKLTLEEVRIFEWNPMWLTVVYDQWQDDKVGKPHAANDKR